MSHSHSHDSHSHDTEFDKSRATVLATFDSYLLNSRQGNTKRKSDFHSLSPKHQALLPNYDELLKQVDLCLKKNNDFLHDMAYTNPFEFNHETGDADAPSEVDHGRLKSTLRQLVRDWSIEGKSERDQIYLPILEKLDSLYSHLNERDKSKIQVLIPGSGLSRLAWEVVRRGYTCQANEFSLYMLIASNYILNETTSVNQYSIHPFIHSFSNIRSNSMLLQTISIPDVLPSKIIDSLGDFSVAAGDFIEVYSAPEQKETFDIVLSCFFLDTAKNVFDYLDTIKHVMKPGGRFINSGPTLWHHEGGESSSIELTLQDLKSVVRDGYGFIIEDEKEITTTYASNAASTMSTVYEASFFVARLK